MSTHSDGSLSPSRSRAPSSIQEASGTTVTAGAPDEIIRTEGLTKVYPSFDDGEDRIAVDRLDLTVCRGEIFGLLGPNGAGKTTTVGMLTTRVLPTSGRAVVGGVDVVAEPARAKHAIGVVHQANTLDRSLTVSENLYFHARYFGMSARTATAATEETLERFRLTHRRKSEVRTLSGGMARRLMVARAILHRPAVLFLNEPTAGLDPQSRLALWDIVGELHDSGQTIMLTTHYMEEADRFCNRVAIVDHGKILALDTPANLKKSADLRHDSAAAAKAKLARLRAIARVAEPDELDDALQRAEEENEFLASSACADSGEELFDEITLESVFIELTGRDLRE
ncbi:MAG: ABC transporter ATP-binding protein [Acidimicrobiales bacterium]